MTTQEVELQSNPPNFRVKSKFCSIYHKVGNVSYYFKVNMVIL